MKCALELDADRLIEVHCGLELRIAECEKQFKRARAEKGKSEWEHLLLCARSALERVAEAQCAIRASHVNSVPAV